MGLQPKCCLAALTLVLFSAGCAKQNVWAFRRRNPYSDNIQSLVEEKLEEQSKSATGLQRWNSFRATELQGEYDIAQDPARLALERKRREAAQRLLENGPLSLTDCLVQGLEFNDQIQASRAGIRSAGGEKTIVRSRFLPRLVYSLTASCGENIRRSVASSVLASATVLEFGKDNPIDVALRDLQRQVLFGYEEGVAGVLSEVRLRFFTILLRQQQLAERRKLRDEFAAQYERIRRLEKAGWRVEVDVLTARLSVLNEEARINSLEKEILRQRTDLLRAIGFPVDMTDFELTGELEKLDMGLAESVEIAFKRSTQIAQARASVFEQDRAVRQLVWEYLPSVRVQAAYVGSSGAVGMDLQTNDNVYSLGPFAEIHGGGFDDSAFLTDATWQDTNESGWRSSIDLELPLFLGGERAGRFQREKALLDRARHLLCDVVAEAELEVSKSYQTVLEEIRQTEILQETVRISRERLKAKERLKELDRITDNELETFRERFFADQDDYFEQQIRLVRAQEQLRLATRYFEPSSAEGDAE